MHLTFAAVSLKPIMVFFNADLGRVFMHFTFVTVFFTRIAVPFFFYLGHSIIVALNLRLFLLRVGHLLLYSS